MTSRQNKFLHEVLSVPDLILARPDAQDAAVFVHGPNEPGPHRQVLVVQRGVLLHRLLELLDRLVRQAEVLKIARCAHMCLSMRKRSCARSILPATVRPPSLTAACHPPSLSSALLLCWCVLLLMLLHLLIHLFSLLFFL